MEIKCPLPKFDPHTYPACFMDPTSAQFGYHYAFPVALPVSSDGRPVHLEHRCAQPQHGYYNLTPSASPVPGHGFVNPVSPDSRLFHLYDSNSAGLLGASSLAVGAQVVHLGFQDTAPIEWDIYPLLLSLELDGADLGSPTSAHLTIPHHNPTTSNQEAENLNSAFDPPSSSPLSTRVDQAEEAIPLNVDTVSPTELWPYLDIRDDGVCVCLWEKSSGEACGFRSSIDLVKRHLRRKHFKSK